MQISYSKNQIFEVNTVIRIDRNKFRQVKFNINLSSIENRKATLAIFRHNSILQKFNFKIFSQNSITDESITKRYQVYVNKRTRKDISKDEEYVSNITSIQRL